ncbi:MAG: hypothetical protein HHAS10_01300 [Candidatus Altimarinota bacterium]
MVKVDETGVVQPTQTQEGVLEKLQAQLKDGVTQVIEGESTGEELVAYAHLLSLTREGANASLLQESHPLYDKVFYKASSIEQNPDGTYVVITEDSFVRLNDKVDAPKIATVGELRNKSKEGILFSGVAALSIETKDGKRIPLLRRDAGAPTDAGKYTLPAGRADKSPGLTAYEESLEEIVLIGRKNGKPEIIVPYLEGGGIPIVKAILLVQLARTRYLSKRIKSEGNVGLKEVLEILEAPLTIKTLTLGPGKNVKTVFATGLTKIFLPQGIEEGGIHTFHDEGVNTFEFIRSFSLDLTEYDTLSVADGDGFGREAGLYEEKQVQTFVEEGETVTSLKAANQLGAFGKKTKL